ncbi:hypothetical protein BDQ17DRAFT_1336335 [Cyathus striatus]|nr:hypothetical protein BDQ17DRAFT_1336335 [Cyathus striatus]
MTRKFDVRRRAWEKLNLQQRQGNVTATPNLTKKFKSATSQQRHSNVTQRQATPGNVKQHPATPSNHVHEQDLNTGPQQATPGNAKIKYATSGNANATPGNVTWATSKYRATSNSVGPYYVKHTLEFQVSYNSNCKSYMTNMNLSGLCFKKMDVDLGYKSHQYRSRMNRTDTGGRSLIDRGTANPSAGTSEIATV